MALLQTIQEYAPGDGNDVMSDLRYICKSCALITEALRKGCDVMQLEDGRIIITYVKIVTFQYDWDSNKGKMVRVQSGGKTHKNKTGKSKGKESLIPEDEEEFV